MKAISAIFNQAIRFTEQGTSNSNLHGRESLRKRVRLVNILSTVMWVFTLCSLPFDLMNAPRWMLGVDAVGILVPPLVPFLNRKGHYLISRLTFFLVTDLALFAAAYWLDLNSGVYLVSFGLVAFGMVLFEPREFSWAFWMPLLPVVQYFYLIFREGGSPEPYFVYSSAATFIFICAGVYFLLHTSEKMELELKRSRASAILSEKMAALGEMSSGVAHEINTPLTVMQLNLHLLQHKLAAVTQDTQEVGDVVKKIGKMVERINDVTHAMQNFSRSGASDPAVETSVEKIIYETLELCQERFKKHHVDLIVDPIPEGASIHCRPVEISQVLLNLLNNAFQAVSVLESRWVRIRTESDADGVRIFVSDSGRGVAQEIRNKIFQPFFTTKPPGQGTGLGLSVSKGIIESHQGRIFLTSDSAHTEFVLEFKRESKND